MTTFQIGATYTNDLAITVTSRTAKTITIESRIFGTDRVKVRTHANGAEWILYKGELINATDLHNRAEAQSEAITKHQN